MEFAVLGPIEARVEGQALPLGGPKQRALLAMLLLNANEVVSRDRLVDSLWGERAPASAQRSLDTYVSRLRALLGGDRIERRAPGYLLLVRPGELDLERFEAQLEEGRAAAAAGDATSARAHLREALVLWRGHALADLENEPFAASETARLEERRLLAQEACIDAELELGLGSELVGELESLVGEHPYRERLVGQLMLSLYRAGRKADALGAFQSFRRRFAEELGLEPSRELRDLERRVLEDDATLGASVGRRPSRRRRRSLSRPQLLVAFVALAAVAASAVVGVVLGTGESSASTAKRSTTAIFEIKGSGPVSARASLAGAPTAMGADAHSIWLAEPGAGAVQRVDQSTGQVMERVTVGGSPSALTVGGGSVWVASVPGEFVDRIDDGTEAVTQRIDLGDGRVAALAFGLGRLWVADATDGEVIAYDPHTGHRLQAFPIDVIPSGLAVGLGGIWVTDYQSGRVEGLDPRSGASLGTIRVGDGPTALAVGDDAIWVANTLDSTVSRIDPTTDTPGPAIGVGNTPVALAVDGNSVSVANEYDSTVSRIDATHDTLTSTTRVAGGPTAIVAAGGRIWVGTRRLGVNRGGTFVMLHTRSLTLDTALQEDMPPSQSDGMTNDALLASDSAGPEPMLVPDLAVSVPTAADGGTTYTFKLRRRIPYDDGRLVRPEDFRRALERLFRVRAGWSSNYTSIIGASECTRARCDLSRGIVVDDAANTVTFHLRAPDPNFFYNMTCLCTAPVPPGVPFHNTGFTQIPGTGPYKVAFANAHQIRYVRNPRFHEWSHPAQPDGNPDVIIMRSGLTQAQEVRAVEREQADWTSDSVPGTLLPDVASRFPSQVHSLLTTQTDFLQLNTTAPPFDDIRVRRALNFAIDRAAVARMYGGRAGATPACQILAPGLQGYKPYCPWRTPDLTRARHLVEASGTRGIRVTAYGLAGGGVAGTTVIRYAARVLRQLGYRARARILPQSYYDKASRATWRRMQIASISVLALSPYDFINSEFGCNAPSGHSWFCDPSFDAELRHAQALETTDPRAAGSFWTKIDRELDDRALAVPLVNPHLVDFVSTHVHHYSADPNLGLIVDQVSVR